MLATPYAVHALHSLETIRNQCATLLESGATSKNPCDVQALMQKSVKKQIAAYDVLAELGYVWVDETWRKK